MGSGTRYARAFDWRNHEYTRKPLKFSNTEAGFQTFKAWMEDIEEKYGKTKELDDNPNKNDRKDPKTIAALPEAGNGSIQNLVRRKNNFERHKNSVFIVYCFLL